MNKLMLDSSETAEEITGFVYSDPRKIRPICGDSYDAKAPEPKLDYCPVCGNHKNTDMIYVRLKKIREQLDKIERSLNG